MRRGAIKEMVGALTSATNVVAESRVMVLGTSSMGLVRDLMRAGMNFSIYQRYKHLTPPRSGVTYILVLHEGDGLLESGLGGFLDVCLGVPDGLGKDGDNVRHGSAHLLWGRDDELLEDVETTNLDLPLAGSLDLGQESREDDRSGPWVHGLDDGLDGRDGGIFDFGGFVGKGLEERWEWRVWSSGDDVWLEHGSGAILAEGRDGRAGCLSDGGGFLVAQGLQHK